MDAMPTPWSHPDLLPPKPSDGTYGYMEKDRPTECSQETLIKRCRQTANSQSMLVWAPESPRIVPAIELPFLHDAIREQTRAAMRDTLKWACLCVVLYGLPAILAAGSRRFEYQLLMLLSMGVIPLAESWWQLRQLRYNAPEVLAMKAASARYAVWMGRQRATTTHVLLAVIVLVFVVQLIDGLGDSIPRAGLTKSGWELRDFTRPLTATLMHGNFMHLLMNAIMLFYCGGAVEALLGRAGLALIFTASALGGSAFSLAFTEKTSVGASGGIMGLLGCLAVLGVHFRKSLPPRYGRQMLYGIFLTGVTGFVARQIIDNAAHAGGLLVGVVLGGLLVHAQSSLPVPPPPTARWIGRMAFALVVAGAVYIGLLVFGAA